MEVLERAPVETPQDSAGPDYHELIRAGIAGEYERVDRLYRALAFRYHPDNRETGDAEVFMRIGQAYRIPSGSPPQPAESGVAKCPGTCGRRGRSP